MATVDLGTFDLFNPTDEHRMLRDTLRDFVKKEVEPQAEDHDRSEKFNLPLFRKMGELGLLGLQVPAEDGGGGADTLSYALVVEELVPGAPDVVHDLFAAILLQRRANTRREVIQHFVPAHTFPFALAALAHAF